MNPAFWKLSMGPGGRNKDFKDILTVLDWLRRGVVTVNWYTGPKGASEVTQGEHFVEKERTGDYFYLCHGNQEPSIILFGQFTGPANLFSEWGDGWAERPFRWIETATRCSRYQGDDKWWAPNHPSTFVQVPEKELGEFERLILAPFFGISLSEYGVNTA